MKTLTIICISLFAIIVLASFSIRNRVATLPAEDAYISCYNPETVEEFKKSGNHAGFAVLHPTPLPFKLDKPRGKMISFNTADGKQAQAYELRTKKPSNHYLLVIQEWWGLNDYIKTEAERLFDKLENVNVLALDLYDGKVAQTRDSAMKYVQGVSNERIVNIVRGSISYAGKEARIYTIGWCFGGMWSLQSALLAGHQAKGCVMYYGRPETNVEKLKQLNTDVIGFFGLKDKNPTPELVDEFEKAMTAAGKQLHKHMYDAGHGFANPSNPNHDKKATEDAWDKSIDYLRQRMKN